MEVNDHDEGIAHQETASWWWISVAIALASICIVSKVIVHPRKKKEESSMPQNGAQPQEQRRKWLDSLEQRMSKEKNSPNEAALYEENFGEKPKEKIKPKKMKKTLPSVQAKRERPPMATTCYSRPGLEHFDRWYQIEASLFRIYVINTFEEDVVCPFIPRSERGHVSLELEVTNETYCDVKVYWIDFKGTEVHKGTLRRGGVWYQTTWIGHPWTFRDENDTLLFHYIPYKVAVSTDQVRTSSDDGRIGKYKFTVLPSPNQACRIVDKVFPTHMATLSEAVTWTLQHMSRAMVTGYYNVDLLITYMTNIMEHPDQIKYRQIRIANPTFYGSVWNTPSRGILLAAGFVERGAYCELGGSTRLPQVALNELGGLILRCQHWKATQSVVETQPEGAADGYGRAGFGRAGQIS